MRTNRRRVGLAAVACSDATQVQKVRLRVLAGSEWRFIPTLSAIYDRPYFGYGTGYVAWSSAAAWEPSEAFVGNIRRLQTHCVEDFMLFTI